MEGPLHRWKAVLEFSQGGFFNALVYHPSGASG